MYHLLKYISIALLHIVCGTCYYVLPLLINSLTHLSQTWAGCCCWDITFFFFRHHHKNMFPRVVQVYTERRTGKTIKGTIITSLLTMMCYSILYVCFLCSAGGRRKSLNLSKLNMIPEAAAQSKSLFTGWKKEHQVTRSLTIRRKVTQKQKVCLCHPTGEVALIKKQLVIIQGRIKLSLRMRLCKNVQNVLTLQMQQPRKMLRNLKAARMKIPLRQVVRHRSATVLFLLNKRNTDKIENRRNAKLRK